MHSIGRAPLREQRCRLRPLGTKAPAARERLIIPGPRARFYLRSADRLELAAKLDTSGEDTIPFFVLTFPLVPPLVLPIHGPYMDH